MSKQRVKVAPRAEKENQDFFANTRVSSKVLAFVVRERGLQPDKIANIIDVDPAKVVNREARLTLGNIEAISKAVNLETPVLLWQALKPKALAKRKKAIPDKVGMLFREVYPTCVRAKTGLPLASFEIAKHSAKKPKLHKLAALGSIAE